MKISVFIFFLGLIMSGFAQVDRDQLSLEISKAEAANLEKLKPYLWRRETVVTVDGQVKSNALSEMNFDSTGKLSVKNLEAKSTDKDKRGLRGRIQANAKEDAMEYVEKAMQLAISYTYLSKGQLIDFFSKAEITESKGLIQVVAKDVLVKGDVVTFSIDPKTKLFVHKTFSSKLGEDDISADIEYGKLSTGESHATKTVLNLPAKKAIITSVNTDYYTKVQ